MRPRANDEMSPTERSEIERWTQVSVFIYGGLFAIAIAGMALLSTTPADAPPVETAAASVPR